MTVKLRGERMQTPSRISMSRLVNTFLAVMISATGCVDSHPYEPFVPSAPPPSPPLPIKFEFPRPSRAATIYVEPNGHMYSRYVLFDDGKVSLQFAIPHFFEYPADRSGPDAQMVFTFGSDSFATASLRGDSLRVSYNDNMAMADFTDGVYVLAERIQ